MNVDKVHNKKKAKQLNNNNDSNKQQQTYEGLLSDKRSVLKDQPQIG
jgi:hypothetical protein